MIKCCIVLILALLLPGQEAHAGGEIYTRAVINANVGATSVTAIAGEALRNNISKCSALGLVETYQEYGNIHNSQVAYSLVCLRNPFRADYVITGGFECDYDADARWTAHTKRCEDDITKRLYSEFVTPNNFWDEKKFSVPPYQMKFQLRHFSIGTDCTLRAGGSKMEWRCIKANVSGGTLVLTTSSNERLKPLQQIDGLRDYEDAFTADISGAKGMCDIGYEGTSNHLAWNCTGNDAQLAPVQIWQQPWPDLLPLVKQWCESQWQDDYALQSICVNGQRDGYDLLQRSLPVPEAVGTRIKDYCGRSWENNFALQAVCVRSQLEGYERMNGRR